MKKEYLFLIALLFLLCCSTENDPVIPLKPTEKGSVDLVFMSRAETTFENIFKLYWSDRVNLLYGSYPNSLGTASDPRSPEHNIHAYLWGFGAVFSSFNAIVQHTENLEFRGKYEAKIKSALVQYYNTSKTPPGYSCFVYDFDMRLYDDAIWIGIDLADLYMKTRDSWYIDYAKSVWTFIMSGKDNMLGGGIYWDENSKNSKNTCSNAPAVVLGVKLYQATGDNSYLETAKEIYQWTKNTLQDPDDYLYWDNIKLDGRIEKPKYSYNSGQMLQAGVLLYNTTKSNQYLNDAKSVAEASYNYFFENFTSKSGEQFRIIKDGSLWFNAVMVRGFVELNQVEENGKYVTAINKSLENGWNYARESGTGLFNMNLSGDNVDEAKDILHQGAAAELYARMAVK